MSGHTPEPWRLSAGNEIEVMGGASQRVVTRAMCGGMSGIKLAEAEANARRIVAAVNATAGISTEALEAGVIAELRDVLTIAAGVMDNQIGGDFPDLMADIRTVLALAWGDDA